MSFPRYAEYVDSGVEWLEQVPSTWLIKRLGHFFSERREKVSDKEFTPLSVTKNGIVPRLDTAAKTQDGDNRKRVVAGDFVINSRSDRKGSSGLSALDGSVSLICIVLEMKEVFGRYAHHLLRSTVFQEEFYRFGKGIVADLWSTNFSEMKNILIPVPSRFEQTQIARFLDHETAKIDALIAEQKRLIKLLQEKRQAVISHAVTKGLDPNVPMKDSGVEWLGEVPAHWEVAPIRRLIHEHKQGYYTTESYVDVGVKLLRITDLNGRGGLTTKSCPKVSDVPGVENYILKQDDVVFARTGGAGLFGVFEEHERVAFASYLIRFSFNKDSINIRFLRQFLLSSSFQTQLEVQVHGGVNKNVHAEDIKNSVMAVPPIEEQRLISRELEQTELMLDNLMAASEKSISLMSERRSALISAAVTGKIDVRDWQPPVDESAFDEDVRKAGLEASA
ncbi:restriction endonuclease subunit S [Pseudidiomarina sp. WS423]|uniref:restriction endonuclease subunit S n=1 Tax=Pseudidiomarina sp. WS423 TaxID=3425124 RepID=UPI003D6FBC5F